MVEWVNVDLQQQDQIKMLPGRTWYVVALAVYAGCLGVKEAPIGTHIRSWYRRNPKQWIQVSLR